MRDLKMQPYSQMEKRVMEYVTRITEGKETGGDDPIGWLMASHEVMAKDRARHIEEGKLP